MRHAVKVRWALFVAGPVLAALVLFGTWLLAMRTAS